jgi:hypothetical protein
LTRGVAFEELLSCRTALICSGTVARRDVCQQRGLAR